MASNYLDHLTAIAADDIAGLQSAERSYGDSWKKRGGVGAYMMLARKWDRLENALSPGQGASAGQAKIGNRTTRCVPAYDIFAAAEYDQRSEGIIDDIRDLRRYLMLVEAEIRARGVNPAHRDNVEVPKLTGNLKHCIPDDGTAPIVLP